VANAGKEVASRRATAKRDEIRMGLTSGKNLARGQTVSRIAGVAMRTKPNAVNDSSKIDLDRENPILSRL